MTIRFHLIPERHGQTDGRTDRIAISISRVSALNLTVKQVALNAIDRDKISIVSSQAVLEMSFFSMDTRTMSSLPLVNSLIKNRLFKTEPDVDDPPFQFIHTMDLSVVNTMLHDSPDLIVHRTQIWAVSRPQVGWMQESLAFLDAAVQLLHVRGAVCRQQYDVIMTS